MWDEIFRERPFRLETSEFAKECIRYFPKKSRVLELGCGIGKDSIFFSKNGHKITVIDFSKEAVKKAEKNTESLGVKNINFLNQDISKKFNFKDASFDVIYAHLALHYFNDIVTKRIFKEIGRVLRRGGIFCACCKSTNDPLYGKGKLIEKDMYVLNGHVRHFFSEEYFKEKLKEKFKIRKLWTGKTKFYENSSAFAKVISERK